MIEPRLVGPALTPKRELLGASIVALTVEFFLLGLRLETT
jgi:hypothetical protein